MEYHIVDFINNNRSNVVLKCGSASNMEMEFEILIPDKFRKKVHANDAVTTYTDHSNKLLGWVDWDNGYGYIHPDWD